MGKVIDAVARFNERRKIQISIFDGLKAYKDFEAEVERYKKLYNVTKDKNGKWVQVQK